MVRDTYQSVNEGEQRNSYGDENLVEAKISWEMGKCLGLSTRNLDDVWEVLCKMRKVDDANKDKAASKCSRGCPKKKN